jgi:DNA-binding response OmpR family regulator
MSFLDKCRTVWSLRDRSVPRKKGEAKVEILVFTPDDRLFSSLLYITTRYGWAVQWAKSTDRAMEILKKRTISILIYDWYLPQTDWSSAVARFARVSNDTCIVLAAQQVDEDIWERAIESGAYDVIYRSGHAAEQAITLRFAWTWNTGHAPHSRVCCGRSSSTWNSIVSGLSA